MVGHRRLTAMSAHPPSAKLPAPLFTMQIGKTDIIIDRPYPKPLYVPRAKRDTYVALTVAVTCDIDRLKECFENDITKVHNDAGLCIMSTDDACRLIRSCGVAIISLVLQGGKIIDMEWFMHAFSASDIRSLSLVFRDFNNIDSIFQTVLFPDVGRVLVDCYDGAYMGINPGKDCCFRGLSNIFGNKVYSIDIGNITCTDGSFTDEMQLVIAKCPAIRWFDLTYGNDCSTMCQLLTMVLQGCKTLRKISIQSSLCMVNSPLEIDLNAARQVPLIEQCVKDAVRQRCIQGLEQPQSVVVNGEQRNTELVDEVAGKYMLQQKCIAFSRTKTLDADMIRKICRHCGLIVPS